MKKLNDKKQVVAQISAAARLYKKNLVGKHFLYVFDGRAIEVAYQAKGFRHLTGVDTGLDAMSFYKKAVSGTLQANQIFFSPHHPYQLCQRKIVHLSDIARHGHFRVLYAGKISRLKRSRFSSARRTLPLCSA